MKDLDRVIQDDGKFIRISTRKSYREALRLMHDDLTDAKQFEIGENITKLLERLHLKLIIFNFENVIFHSNYSGVLKVIFITCMNEYLLL
jgi:hypothetical protein